jgi:WD40 repeat protein
MIVLACAGCDRKMRLDDDLAGKKVRCPACKATTVVPAAGAELAAAPADPPPAAVQQPPAEPPVRHPPEPREDRERERERPRREDRQRPAAKPRSRAPLVIGCLAGLVVLLAAGVVVCYFVFLRGPWPGDWQEFSPDGAGYAVKMPGAPVEKTDPTSKVAGRKFVLQRDRDKQLFTVAHLDAPLPATPGSLTTLYLAERDHFVKSSGARVVGQGRVETGGVEGQEFRAETPDGLVLTERVFLVKRDGGSRCYVVAVLCKSGDPAAVTFLDSFRILTEQGPQKKEQPPEVQPSPTGEYPVWKETSSDRTISLAFCGDDRRLAVGHWGSTLRLWDARAGKDRALYKDVGGHPSPMAARGDGKQVAFGIGGRVVFWDVDEGKEVGRAQVEHEIAKNARDVLALAYTPDGKSLAVAIRPGGGGDGEIHLWGCDEKKVLTTRRRIPEIPVRLTFLPEGKLVVALQTRAQVCDARTLEVKKELEQTSDKEAFIALAASADGKWLAAVCEDGKLRLWDLGTSDLSKTWPITAKAHRHAGFPLAFSPDGTMIAFGAQGNVLHVYDTATGKEGNRPIDGGASGSIDLLAFSPDGKLLALHGYTGPKVIMTDSLKALLKP